MTHDMSDALRLGYIPENGFTPDDVMSAAREYRNRDRSKDVRSIPKDATKIGEYCESSYYRVVFWRLQDGHVQASGGWYR